MVPTIQSPLLAALPGVRHAFFTRRGGVSTGVYESLNTGPGSDDDPEAVQENRARAAAVFGVGPGRLLTAYQIHSAEVVTADAPWTERPRADGVVTATPGLVCGALAADCAPVLIADSEARVVAAVHAGWRGALGGVVQAAVAAMTALGAQPSRMVAAVGPCIGPEHYEVGPEVADAFEQAGLPQAVIRTSGRRPHVDLAAAVTDQLVAAGVAPSAIDRSDCCTFRDSDLFFSHRRDAGVTGRMAAVVAVRESGHGPGGDARRAELAERRMP